MVKQIILCFLFGCSSFNSATIKKQVKLYFLDVEYKRICEDLFDSSTCQPLDDKGRYLVLTEENFFILAEKISECRVK